MARRSPKESKQRTSRRTRSRSLAQNSRSETQSPSPSISARSDHSPNRSEDRSLKKITLSITEIDGTETARMIGIYRHMKVSELQRMIRSAFRLSANVKLIGVASVDRQYLIPLSYLIEKPSTFASPYTNDTDIVQTYSLIIERSGTGMEGWIVWLRLITKYSQEHKQTTQTVIGIIVILCAIFCGIWLEFGFPFLILIRILENLLTAPILGALYRRGPKIPFLGSYGFWAGKADAVICAEMTGNVAAFWKRNEVECAEMIAIEQRNFVTLIELVVTLWICVWFLRRFMRYTADRLLNDRYIRRRM